MGSVPNGQSGSGDYNKLMQLQLFGLMGNQIQNQSHNWIWCSQISIRMDPLNY